MDRRIEQLREMGCDVEDAMERFLDDEEFYLECLGQVVEDENFQRLETYLENRQLREGFDCAHTLKGLVANLGLSSLNERVVKIVEPLRNGSSQDLMEEYRDLMRELERYKKIMADS